MNPVKETITKGESQQEFRKRMTDAYFDVARHYHAIVAPFTFMVSIYICDLLDEIEENKKLYRFTVKKNVAKVREAFDEYARNIEKALNITKDGCGRNRNALVQQIGVELLSSLDTDISRLTFAVKNFLDKNNEDDSDFRSRLEVGSALLYINGILFNDMFIQYKNKYGADFSQDFAVGRMEKAIHYYTLILDKLCRTTKKIDLNEDESIQLGCRIILKKASQHETINKAGAAAMRRDPLYQKILEEENAE